MSLRLRLSLLYGALIGLTLIIFSGAVYFTVARVTLGVLQQTLQDDAERLSRSPDLGPERGGGFERRGGPSRPPIAPPDTYVQTVNAAGQVTLQTPNLSGFTLPLSEAGWQAVRSGSGWIETVQLDNGRFLVYSLPARGPGQAAGSVVQVARSLADQDAALNALRNILVPGGLLATLLTAGASWLLAGAALRPLDRITQTAEAIGANHDFSRRLRPAGARDEVGRLATTFNAMLNELESAFEHQAAALSAQRRFVADASHELRTPLTTIRGNIALLQRDPPIRERDRIAVLGDTVEEIERLIRLVNNLLLLARNDAGQLLPDQSVPLAPLLAELRRQTRVLAPDREIAGGETSGLSARANPDALKQVLIILLDNARQHTPAGGRITLSAAAQGAEVVLRVADTGPGIAADVLPHLFDRFYRADKARSGGGAGLGLAIARQLIEAQHGTIAVESQPGQGSLFTIRLPRAVDGVTAESPAERGAATAAPAAGAPGH